VFGFTLWHGALPWLVQRCRTRGAGSAQSLLRSAAVRLLRHGRLIRLRVGKVRRVDGGGGARAPSARARAALVGRDGSIDWLCWPRFDSAACFAALVGSRDNGRWLIGAADPKARIRRRYRDSTTLILETAIETADGAATVLDFMPPRDQASAIVRLVSGRRGRLAMRTELIIRFDYGSLTPWVTRLHDGSLRAVARPDMVVLRTPAPLRGVDFKTVGEFTISAGESVPFVLSYGPSYLPPPQPIDPAKALATTETIWSDWISKAHTAGEWSEAVSRSLITLKALTYHPSGAIAAAPTTSLRATTRQVATL
jgi:GH15 family glucan-1,4-alpha-glucosidase